MPDDVIPEELTDEEKELEAELGPEQADDDGPEENELEESEEELEDDTLGVEEGDPTLPLGVVDEQDLDDLDDDATD